jgi:pyrroloquinoline quinone biosynthesis protein E
MSPTLTDASPVLADPADSLAVMERTRSTAETFGIPLAVLAELTHRCPLQCPYCSNPVELDRSNTELTTAEWKKILSELAEIGVLQIHFSGGEPTARKDIVELVQHASDVGLYSNLITSAVMLTRDKLTALADAGLCHVQISFQGNEPVVADRVGGYRGGHARKLEVARWTRELDLPLTVNAVMHRQNLHQLEDIIAMAVDLDADRLEVANVQYYGWALKNRAALMPTEQQIEATSRIVDDARERLRGILDIDYVVPDYYALRPKKCMGGWGRQFFNISPSGKVLPCHAAESIAGLDFESVRSNHSIAWIWQNSEAFNRYRGTGWMPEPCRSCEFREIDFGGCRCQAFALTGDAGNTDPACTLSPVHVEIFKLAAAESAEGSDRFVYRNFKGGTLESGSDADPLPPPGEAPQPLPE